MDDRGRKVEPSIPGKVEDQRTEPPGAASQPSEPLPANCGGYQMGLRNPSIGTESEYHSLFSYENYSGHQNEPNQQNDSSNSNQASLQETAAPYQNHSGYENQSGYQNESHYRYFENPPSSSPAGSPKDVQITSGMKQPTQVVISDDVSTPSFDKFADRFATGLRRAPPRKVALKPGFKRFSKVYPWWMLLIPHVWVCPILICVSLYMTVVVVLQVPLKGSTQAGSVASLFFLWIFAIIWTSFVVFGMGSYALIAHQAKKIIQNGKVTSGIITQARMQSGKSTAYFFEYEYEAPEPKIGIKLFTREMMIPKDEWSQTKVGKKVTVVYRPKNPMKSVIYDYADFAAVG